VHGLSSSEGNLSIPQERRATSISGDPRHYTEISVMGRRPERNRRAKMVVVTNSSEREAVDCASLSLICRLPRASGSIWRRTHTGSRRRREGRELHCAQTHAGPARGIDRRGPDLVAEPVRLGRPVPADRVLGAAIGRTGVGRDQQLHAAAAPRPAQRPLTSLARKSSTR
jgi:hypothetical protein